jgi:glycosyltransferase involved in cell wall biosynthesis
MIDRLTSPLADAIMVNSRTAAESVLKREKFSAKKVRVVYNGIDHRALTATDSREKVRSTLGIAHSAPVIISVARLHREKGSDFIPEIAENVRSAVFLMVGDGEERKPLERDLGQRGLLNRFLFTGWRSDIADLLKASDIFLLPSREESFPQAILEAMACSLPVVAVEIGGVKELVNDRTSGFLVKAGNVKGFSEALNHLIENPDEMRRMGNEGYRISLQFSENKMVQDMRGLYQEQLSRKAKV